MTNQENYNCKNSVETNTTSFNENLNNWLQSSGDLDDFIFWNEPPSVCSER